MSPTKKLFEELIEVLRNIQGELIKIEEAIRDCALPRSTQINVRKK